MRKMALASRKAIKTVYYTNKIMVIASVIIMMYEIMRVILLTLKCPDGKYPILLVEKLKIKELITQLDMFTNYPGYLNYIIPGMILVGMIIVVVFCYKKYKPQPLLYAMTTIYIVIINDILLPVLNTNSEPLLNEYMKTITDKESIFRANHDAALLSFKALTIAAIIVVSKLVLQIIFNKHHEFDENIKAGVYNV